MPSRGEKIEAGELAKSVEDVQEYMVLWHVKYGNHSWIWADSGPQRPKDNQVWVAWRDREVAEGRLVLNSVSGFHSLTAKWTEDMASEIVRYKLLLAK